MHVVLELTRSPVPAMGVATGTTVAASANTATTTAEASPDTSGSSLILLLLVQLLLVWLVLGSGGHSTARSPAPQAKHALVPLTHWLGCLL